MFLICLYLGIDLDKGKYNDFIYRHFRYLYMLMFALEHLFWCKFEYGYDICYYMNLL